MNKVTKEQKEQILQKEISLLDKIYKDMVDTLGEKPNPDNHEAMRLYVDNMDNLITRTMFLVKEVKTTLEKDKKLILETWNPPA